LNLSSLEVEHVISNGGSKKYYAEFDKNCLTLVGLLELLRNLSIKSDNAHMLNKENLKNKKYRPTVGCWCLAEVEFDSFPM